jgi:metal-responsive CopG/Arc/MetJ family transcriptional regulator
MAQEFLAKAEAVRSAAIEAAVRREVEREQQSEQLEQKDAALLHLALDMQARARMGRLRDGSVAATVLRRKGAWGDKEVLE